MSKINLSLTPSYHQMVELVYEEDEKKLFFNKTQEGIH